MIKLLLLVVIAVVAMFVWFSLRGSDAEAPPQAEEPAPALAVNVSDADLETLRQTAVEALKNVDVSRVADFMRGLEGETGDFICAVANGEHEPTLSLEEFTDDRWAKAGILLYCSARSP